MSEPTLKKSRCKVCRDEFLLVELENGVCADCAETQRKKEKYNERRKNSEERNRRNDVR